MSNLIVPDLVSRFNRYVGCLVNHSEQKFCIKEDAKNFIAYPGMSFDLFWRSMLAYPYGKKFLKEWSVLTLESRYRSYMLPIINLQSSNSIQQPALVHGYDNIGDFDLPVFCKSAGISSNKKSRFIMPLDYDRHWIGVNEVEKYDINFHKKQSKVFWRGATTGSFTSRDKSKSSQRLMLAKQFNNLSCHDVGFTSIVQLNDKNTEIPIESLKQMIKPPADIQQQLKFKYLLSLEGNDVASGLKWMLFSNSVVLMPQPTVESWACESLLRPFVHYVPLKNDLTDVHDMFEWCENNSLEAEEIAQNGRLFIKSFLDKEISRVLTNEVFTAYYKTSFYFHNDFASKIKRFSPGLLPDW